MNKFEQIGVNLQYDAMNKEQALRAFRYSCECCCTKGMWLNCEHCAIYCTHQLVMACFDSKMK